MDESLTAYHKEIYRHDPKVAEQSGQLEKQWAKKILDEISLKKMNGPQL